MKQATVICIHRNDESWATVRLLLPYRSIVVTRRTTNCYVLYIERERVRDYMHEPTTIDKGGEHFDFKYAKGAGKQWLSQMKKIC